MRRGIGLALAVALACAAVAWAAQNDTTLVSRASGAAGASANGEAREASISADGRYVAFRSSATNLSPDDPSAGADVYVRDLQTNTTTLVSRATGATGAKANSDSTRPMISGNGRYVVFETDSTNLDPADADSVADVYVRDLQTNTTILISRDSGASGAKGNGQSFRPSISSDGNRVAFQSSASNLAGDADANGDVFVRDIGASTTILVSRANGAGGANANGESFDPSISADGTAVAFSSQATNLDAADPDSTLDVYVRNLSADTTSLASRAAGVAGAKGDADSTAPSLSSDGSRVAFQSVAGNLSPDDPNDGFPSIFVRDVGAGTTTLASRATGAAGANGYGSEPSISSDGTKVAFHSFKAGMDPSDPDTNFDVFVRDLGADTTTLVSRASGASGAKGNDSSQLSQSGAHLSADGSFIAFDSIATNLSSADSSSLSSVYVRQLGADPSFLLSVSRAGTGGGSVTSDVPGISCGATCSAPYTSGTVVTLTAGPSAGSVFAGWSGDCSGTATCVVTMTAARSVTATFDLVPAGGGGGGGGGGSGSGGSGSGSGGGGSGSGGSGSGSGGGGSGSGGSGSGSGGGGSGSGGSGSGSGGGAGGGGAGGGLLPGPCANLQTGKVLTGSAAGDRLVGTAGKDRLRGLGGDDCLVGLGQADVLIGGGGNDRIEGGAGNDRLVGGAGDDRLYGGPGADVLQAGRGRNTLYGGRGNDHLTTRNGLPDRVYCGRGSDRVVADLLDTVTLDCETVDRK